LSSHSPAKPVAIARARVASLTRSRTNDDPVLVDARLTLKAANLEEYVAKVVATAPPLTPAQRDRIASLLRPVGGASV